ncbi:protein disulfide isomerase [Dictyostelium discoideum AX4]|uniref:Protein disulfide-isomerase 2 n=1 Tax=Dictyostelium discoideum TaxID=44689 RepID=PDI2_DICDI|nr:protein disulfide isomerase [Dictyostelium discoideum AX4]Q54EN4.1 RecName: Full=Protein disulfide-isomerase 2; Short=PDI2; Flags: Precursor [Dictyostelium discoideum]EAL61701.1 protein disulfide isomerase [Dictyostelium discoideum AX4]|eukprot:XP_635206.1 protein disulfide isomerase [Dictyostelium discoideum AX4]
MNKFLALLFVLALFANIAFSCEGHPEHDHGDGDHEHDHDESFVKILDSDNFHNSVSEHDVTLVMFYAPWCGHCKTLKPLYEEAAKQLSANKKIAIAKVDCTQHEQLCKQNKVQGYPTLVVFKNGKAEPYEGDRTTKSIVQTLEEELKPTISTLESNEDIEEFKKQHPISVVGFFDNDHDDRFKLFSELAGNNKKSAKFAVVIDKDFSKEHVESTPNVVLFRSFDEPTVAHKGEFDSESLIKFIKGNSVPLLGEINRNTYKKYESIAVPLAYLFIDSTQDNTQVLEDVKKIATSQKGNAVFCWVDMKKFPQQATHMGLSGKVVPAISVDSVANKARYNFDEKETFSFDTVSKWIQDVIGGKVSPFVKSQPEPESNDAPVKVAVGTTFKKLVLDSPKDVLVEFYAPWCGHCKNLAPIYDKLGEYLKDVESVSIVKIDADSNDVPSDIEIRGYPTIMLFKADDKENPISYEGQRNDHMNFVEFIQDNAAIEFKLPSSQTDDNVESKKDSSAKHDEL